MENSQEEPDECCLKHTGEEEIENESVPLVVEANDENGKKVRIAVAGCSHGEMDRIYEVMSLIEEERGYKFDLLICCGDYQAVRNYGDLHHMHVNERYRSLQTFYKYYSGEKTAPVLTLFIGGNHEASGYLSELPHGGWVAPRIYYMGFANCVRFAGLRIAGLSGIYNRKDFNLSHYERPPFSGKGDTVSAYHARNVDLFRLRQLRPKDDDKISNPIDIMLSHDWPQGIADYGDCDWLFRVKPYIWPDHRDGQLGNPAAMKLLFDLRPRYWFSAHLHVAFAALVPHKEVDGERPAPTKFLSLDKPLPKRQFIQSLELTVAKDAEMKFEYDAEWLAILRNTDQFTIAGKEIIELPQPKNAPNTEERVDFRASCEEMEEIGKLGDLRIPDDTFRHTAPPLFHDTEEARKAGGSAYYRNPQTAEFCQWLGIRDLNKMLIDTDESHIGIPWYVRSGDNEQAEQETEEFGEADFVIDTFSTEETGPDAKKVRIEEE